MHLVLSLQGSSHPLGPMAGLRGCVSDNCLLFSALLCFVGYSYIACGYGQGIRSRVGIDWWIVAGTSLCGLVYLAGVKWLRC